MRNLLAFSMALLLTLAGVGWYLDWFRIQTTAGSDGHSHVNLDVNTVKAYQDVSKAATKGAELLDKKAKEATDTAEADKKAKEEADKATVKEPQSKTGGGWLN